MIPTLQLCHVYRTVRKNDCVNDRDGDESLIVPLTEYFHFDQFFSENDFRLKHFNSHMYRTAGQGRTPVEKV